MSKGSASSVTDAHLLARPPRPSRANRPRMARRVGSAMAASVVLRESAFIMIYQMDK
jgi:hypothetical protein